MKPPKSFKNLYEYVLATDQFPMLRPSQRLRCLQQVRDHGPMTCDDCRIALDMSNKSSASVRFSELEHDGWIVPTGETKLTRNGGMARVMRATTLTEMKAILAARHAEDVQ